jgi:hypothetical protein
VKKIVKEVCNGTMASTNTRPVNIFHNLEATEIYLLLLQDAEKGLADAEAGRVTDAIASLMRLKKRRVEPR